MYTDEIVPKADYTRCDERPQHWGIIDFEAVLLLGLVLVLSHNFHAMHSALPLRADPQPGSGFVNVPVRTSRRYYREASSPERSTYTDYPFWLLDPTGFAKVYPIHPIGSTTLIQSIQNPSGSNPSNIDPIQ